MQEVSAAKSVNSAGRISIAIFFLILLLTITLTRISDYDFWWHLKLGEEVYQTGSVYAVDSYSYTFSGMPQFRAEWLGNFLIYLSYKTGGFAGIAALKMLLVTCTFWFLFLALRCMTEERDEPAFYAALITMLLVLLSLRFRLFVRPYLFSFMFFSLVLFLIHYYQQRRTGVAYIIFPLVQILWSNISIGAIFGPALVLFALAREWQSSRMPDRRLFNIFLLVVIASLFNPEMQRIYTLPFSALVSSPYKEVLGEHQPVSLQILWGYGLRYTFAYQILVLCSLVHLIFRGGWKNRFHLLLFALFFPVSLLQVRMIDFFSLSAAVLAFPALLRLLTMIPVTVFKKRIAEIVAAGLILVAIIASAGSKTYAFGIGIKDHIFPEKALAFLEKENIQGRMMNSYAFGGYLIWAAPERKVFIDGRHRHLYSPEFYNAYHDALKNAEAWEALNRNWNFDYLLLEYDMMSRRYPKHLSENPDWALVYWDDHSVVLLKQTEQNRAVIDKYAYRIAKPNFYDYGYLQAYLHAKSAPEAVEALKREISLNPKNQEPILARAFLLFNMGPAFHNEAHDELTRALALKPDLSMEHSAMATLLLERGLTDQARAEIRKALDIDPFDGAAQHLMQKLKN
ncbi:MAG: hypothetical protein HZA15_16370 [Nitrospirae bacterium]|nr:hypothetical protein [Nitrospirota bacterium]